MPTPPSTEPRLPQVVVQLTGTDGNAFAILARVIRALRDAGYPDDAVAFHQEATSGDYDHLLRTCMAWVTVE
jgi:hypothetical protein